MAISHDIFLICVDVTFSMDNGFDASRATAAVIVRPRSYEHVYTYVHHFVILHISMSSCVMHQIAYLLRISIILPCACVCICVRPIFCTVERDKRMMVLRIMM